MSAEMSPTAANPESLLRHSGFLAALARALAARPTDSDDLVQETWLAAVRRDEDLLRFGLYLDRKRPDELPKCLQEVQRELGRETGSVLLGFYDGGDPEILGGYVERCRKVLDGEQADPGRAVDAVRMLGQIPAQEATDALLEVIARQEFQPDLLGATVSALAWQRNPRALPALRERLASTPAGDQAAILQAAIRFLE